MHIKQRLAIYCKNHVKIYFTFNSLTSRKAEMIRLYLGIWVNIGAILSKHLGDRDFVFLGSQMHWRQTILEDEKNLILMCEIQNLKGKPYATFHNFLMENFYDMSRLMGKPTICIGQTKAQLISAFVFATRIVQFLFYLNPKFQASSSFLCLYRPVCVGPVRKPYCWFPHEAAHISDLTCVLSPFVPFFHTQNDCVIYFKSNFNRTWCFMAHPYIQVISF